jgi:hypothetical protein
MRRDSKHLIDPNSNPARTGRPVRGRAIFLGLGLVPLLCWWSLRTEVINGGSELIEASLLAIVVFTLFVLTIGNDLLRQRWPAAALTRAELLCIYVIQTTSVGLAGLGQVQFLNQALAGAYHFATPENHWAAFQKYIPAWWVPNRDVLDAYYKGGSTLFTAEHLRGWIVPILVWSGFSLTLVFCFLCLNTLFRRHWIEQERLTFPLVALPLELTREGATRSLLARKEFWAAFALVCAFRSMSGLHRVFPSFPDVPGLRSGGGQQVDLQPYLTQPPWNAVGDFELSFHPMIIGITYFLPLDVSFSAWFFYLVVKAENVLAAALGYRAPGASAASQAVPYTGEQGAGAFLMLGVLAFWGARRHLRAVFRAAFAFHPKSKIQNPKSEGPLSYRAAVFGLLLSFAALVGFMALGGMSWLLAALFFLLYLLMITTVTRLRAEAGPMLNYGPDMNPHRLMTVLPGTQAWNARDLTVFAYTQWFDSDYRTVAMPQQMESLKIAEAAELEPRRLGRWMLLASTLAVFTAFVSVLALYYHYGAATGRGDNPWRLENGQLPFRILQEQLDSPTKPNVLSLEWIGVGAAITAGLARARMQFAWWPFHPAGFAMAHAGWTMPWVWFPTLLGWLSRALLLRYGGMRLYRRCIPWFMGLILGDIVIACLWSIVGVLLDTRMYMFFPG